MYKPLKRFLTASLAFAASITAGFARDFASMKGGFKKKKVSGGKRSGHPYVWGKLGLSAVSTSIREDHDGMILPRKDRKMRYYGNGKRMKQKWA